MSQMLRIEQGETTADKRFTLVELECLGSCGTAPVALINDVLQEELTPEKLQKIIETLPEDPHEYKDPTIDWETREDNGGNRGRR
jgi:NADH:ubiquinone oxidoreductase subunit E